MLETYPLPKPDEFNVKKRILLQAKLGSIEVEKEELKEKLERYGLRKDIVNTKVKDGEHIVMRGRVDVVADGDGLDSCWGEIKKFSKRLLSIERICVAASLEELSLERIPLQMQLLNYVTLEKTVPILDEFFLVGWRSGQQEIQKCVSYLKQLLRSLHCNLFCFCFVGSTPFIK